MAEITNPEKQCKTTPVSFSGESKIERVDKEECRRGIILDSLEEFGQALIVYNDGKAQSSKATEERLFSDIAQEKGAPGADTPGLLRNSTLEGSFLSMGIELLVPDGGSKFAKNLASDAIKTLKSNGRFRRSFDYDVMGTRFFKTTVNGEKVGDKYVLELNAAYVGDKPEGELAKLIGKPMALVSSKAVGILSVVDDWWFNLNLEEAIKPLPVAIDWYKRDYGKTIMSFAKYIGSGGYDGKSPEFEFKHKGKKFSLEIGLRADKYLRPEGGERGSDYMQAREKFIVGGAWTTWAENRNDKCEPRIVKPSLVCSVSLPGEKYSRPAAVTSEEISDVQNTRDYIAGLMQPK